MVNGCQVQQRFEARKQQRVGTFGRWHSKVTPLIRLRLPLAVAGLANCWTSGW
jgi:hypothetical protein